MPVPIIDAAQALKANPEKTEDALLKVAAPRGDLFATVPSPRNHSVVLRCRWSSTC